MSKEITEPPIKLTPEDIEEAKRKTMEEWKKSKQNKKSKSESSNTEDEISKLVVELEKKRRF